MATLLDEVVVKFTAELAGFKKSLQDGVKSVGGLERTVGQLKRALAALGVGLVVREYVKLADTATNLAARIRLVAGSAQQAAAVQRELLAVANRTRVDFESVVTLYARIGRSADALGISQQRLIKFTETFSQALKISGTSTAETSSTVIQLSQALASGYLRGQELNSILENGGRAATALADGLGVPIGTLKKLGEQGELTAEKVIGAIEKQSAAIQNEFNQLPVTVGDALTVAGNRLLAFVGKIDNSSEASRELAKSISELAKVLDDREFAAAITEALRTLVDVFTFLGKAIAGAQMAVTDFFDELNREIEDYKRQAFGILPGPEMPTETPAEMLKGFGEFMSVPKAAGGGSAVAGAPKTDKEAERAARRYAEAMSDLQFEIEQLARTEEEAAFQEQLRNVLSAAGVTLASEQGQALRDQVEAIQSLRDARSLDAAAALEDAARMNRVISEHNEALAEQTRQVQEFYDAFGDAVASSFAAAIIEGEKLSDVLGRLAQQLAELIFQKLVFDQISNAVSAGVQGIVGGFAAGGELNPGNAYQLHRDEVVIPRVPMSVIPAGRGGGGQSITFAPSYNIAAGVNAAQVRMVVDSANAQMLQRMNKFINEQSARGRLKLH